MRLTATWRTPWVWAVATSGGLAIKIIASARQVNPRIIRPPQSFTLMAPSPPARHLLRPSWKRIRLGDRPAGIPISRPSAPLAQFIQLGDDVGPGRPYPQRFFRKLCPD